jgi:hypothetical protein
MIVKKSYFILIYFVLFQNLFGYLDPGTWSYAFQLLIMTLVGGIVAIKTFWQYIKNFFKNFFKKK